MRSDHFAQHHPASALPDVVHSHASQPRAVDPTEGGLPIVGHKRASPEELGVDRMVKNASSPSASAKRPSTVSSHPVMKPNYLALESDYLGHLEFDASPPLPLSDYKNLQYPLASEVYCGYRPTVIELQSSLPHLVSATDVGPSVDLIDPVTAYPVCIPPSPTPEDAALLVGLIPGVEQFLLSAPGTKRASPAASDVTEPKPQHSPSATKSRKDAIDAILEQFSQTTFVHPLKAHLKPVKILELLPSSTLWCNRYVHGSLQQMDRLPSSTSPIVLKAIEEVSQRIRNFALYEPTGGGTESNRRTGPSSTERGEESHTQGVDDSQHGMTGIPSRAPGDGRLQEHQAMRSKLSCSSDGTAVMSPNDCSFIQGDYHFVRDYIARFPEDQQTLATNLILDLPLSSDASPRNTRPAASPSESPSKSSSLCSVSIQPAYFSQLRGPKLLFTRAAGANEARKSRPPLRLVARNPTEAEKLFEASRLEMLRTVDTVPVDSLSDKASSPARRSRYSSSSDSDQSKGSADQHSPAVTETALKRKEHRQSAGARTSSPPQPTTRRRIQNRPMATPKQRTQKRKKKQRARRTSDTSESSISSSGGGLSDASSSDVSSSSPGSKSGSSSSDNDLSASSSDA